MIWFLRVLVAVVLVSMLGVTSWAGLQCPLFAVPRDVATHPWFLATLVDAYWAFIAFYVWIAWKERASLARAWWFVAIILWGSIAIAVYAARELFSVEANGSLDEVVVRHNPGHSGLPLMLTAAGAGVYAYAWIASQS